MNNTSRSNGFTLIELSIVLVLIGLVVGGILLGRVLIQTAELRQVVSQVENMRTAIMTFREKYGGYPGDLKDATAFWSGTVNGNGDSIVSVLSGDGNYVMGDGDDGPEYLRVWQHLALANLISGTYTGLPIDSGASPYYEIGSNVVPAACCATSGYVIWDNGGGGGVTFGNATLSRNRFIVLGGIHEPSGTHVFHRGALFPEEARLLDIKGDDGVAYSGATIGATGTGPLSGWPYLGNWCSSSIFALNNTDDYNLLNTSERACVMLFNIGI